MRDFRFFTSQRPTASVEEILNDTYSANAIKLVSILAEALKVTAPIFKEVKTNKDGKEFTVYRLSSDGANAILDALRK